MQASQTYDYAKNDHTNRANMALICSKYYNIKEVSPSLYQIAAPVSELPFVTKDGGVIHNRKEAQEGIPWNERSMKTFCVVYTYETTASFIGIDGRTYVVPNDKPVIDHLKECGYIIAPYGKNLNGKSNGDDSLIFEEKLEEYSWLTTKTIQVDKKLPPQIINMIDEMEKDRPYYCWCQPYDGVLTFGGTLGLRSATDEEIQQLSLSERKVANILRYGRVRVPQDIEEYVQYALQQAFLNEEKFRRKF